MSLACWKKSQCGLEFHYGNLTLLRLVEVKDYYLADPAITTVTIIDNNKFHKKPNSEFHGIVLEVMDVYPIIKYSEYKFSHEKQTDLSHTGRPHLVRTEPVSRKRKNAKVFYNKPLDDKQKSSSAQKFVSRSDRSTTNQIEHTNKVIDQAKHQTFNVASDYSLLKALDLAVRGKVQLQRKISLTANALLLDKSYGNSYAYRLHEDIANIPQPLLCCDNRVHTLPRNLDSHSPILSQINNTKATNR